MKRHDIHPILRSSSWKRSIPTYVLRSRSVELVIPSRSVLARLRINFGAGPSTLIRFVVSIQISTIFVASYSDSVILQTYVEVDHDATFRMFRDDPPPRPHEDRASALETGEGDLQSH